MRDLWDFFRSTSEVRNKAKDLQYPPSPPLNPSILLHLHRKIHPSSKILSRGGIPPNQNHRPQNSQMLRCLRENRLDRRLESPFPTAIRIGRGLGELPRDRHTHTHRLQYSNSKIDFQFINIALFYLFIFMVNEIIIQIDKFMHLNIQSIQSIQSMIIINLILLFLTNFYLFVFY